MLDPAARDATVRVLEQFRREFDAAQPSPRLLALVDEALNQLWPRRDSQKSSPVTRAIRSLRSEEHTSELQSLMRISYAVFCLKKKILYNTKLQLNASHSINRIYNYNCRKI